MSDSPSSLQPLTAEEKEDRDVKFLRRILLDTPSLPLYQELVTFNQSTQPSARMAELMADTCRKRECLVLGISLYTE